jgi:hypothetical protein
MRAYKFLNECFGMKALIEKRLKQSRIRDLNDPFELRPFDLASPSLRMFSSKLEMIWTRTGA